jgi:putative transposase
MQVMGIEAVYPKPKLSRPGRAHDLSVPAEGGEDDARESGVEHGHHLHSDGARFCVPGGGDGLVQPVRAELGVVVDHGTGLLLGGAAAALRRGRPEIFNSDQGPQFTSDDFTGELEERHIAISMDGRGRCWTTSSSSGCGAR